MRGTISGGGSAPPDEVVLRLMEANRSDWDPEADLGHVTASPELQGEVLAKEVESGSLRRRLRTQWYRTIELDDPIVFEGLLGEVVDPDADDEPGEQPAIAAEWVRYGSEVSQMRRESLLKQKAAKAWRGLKLGYIPPSALIASPPSFLGMVTVTHLYAAQPGWDVDRAARFLRELSIDPGTRIEALTDKQRSRIAGAHRSEPA